MFRNKQIQKYILIVQVLSFQIACTINSQGQDYGGPDKYICTGGSVSIGGEGSAGACYAWSPAEGLSGTNSLNPTASPNETTTYTLKVVGPNFSFSKTETVTVHVIEAIEGINISIKDDKCCWKNGESISAGQFEITTNPPGLESRISQRTFEPSTAPTLVTPVGTAGINITATIQDCNNNQIDLTSSVSIPVVNEDLEETETWSTPEAKLSGAILKLKRLLKLTGGCEPVVAIAGDGQLKFFTLCCSPPNCIKSGMEENFSVAVNGGYECSVRVPYFRIIKAFLYANGQISLSQNYKTQCEEIVTCTGVSLSASFGGGVETSLLGCKVNAQIIGNYQLPTAKYCTPPGKLEFLGPWCISSKLVGTVEFFGSHFKESINWTISEYCSY